MEKSVHSELFYYKIALSKADLNKNGKIDEVEKSIFLQEMKKFDANNDGLINEEDYKINKESMLITEEERKLQQQYEDYATKNPLNKQNADKHITLLEKYNPMALLTKNKKYIDFKNDIINLINYWEETGQFNEIERWTETLNNWFKEQK